MTLYTRAKWPPVDYSPDSVKKDCFMGIPIEKLESLLPGQVVIVNKPPKFNVGETMSNKTYDERKKDALEKELAEVKTAITKQKANPRPDWTGVYVNEECVFVAANEKAAMKQAAKLIEARLNGEETEDAFNRMKISVERIYISKKM